MPKLLLAFACCLTWSRSAVAQTPVASVTPGSVTISLAEYNQLLDRIAAAPAGVANAPVSAVTSRAEIEVRLNGELARATITLQGEVFRAGPTAVPLLAGGTLLDAQANGQTVPLMQDKGGYLAVLPGRGPFTLSLAWAAPVSSEPGRSSIVLPVVTAGSIRAAIDVPGEGSDLRLEPAVITARTAAGGRTTIEATLTPATPTRVTWSSREVSSGAPLRTLRLLSDVKTLVTVGENDLRVAALFDITLIQGSASQLEVRLPQGFELSSVSGPTIEVAAERAGALTLTILERERKRHQFLVTLERATADGATRRDVALPWLDGSQRETGEVSVEGVGALELKVEDQPQLTRIDVGEVASALQSLAREPLLAAYRYQRRAPEAVAIALDVARFPDAAVLTAIAERAVATTLVTAEGRALTEVMLTMRNQAQPFLKVGLPEGAVILSAEVAGAAVKPAQGPDGVRVPLLRAGFKAQGLYTVSFVYLHSGAAFAKKGQAEMSLARVDVPVTWLEWELFLPDRFDVSRFDGQAFARTLLDTAAGEEEGSGRSLWHASKVAPAPPPPGLAETVTVTVAGKDKKENDPAGQSNEPSANVQSLQRRAAGILPVRIDVPRAGRSHTFVRPLVLDEETRVAFRYRSR